MLNLIFIILSLLFLVSRKILLLNEETLILLCFTIFIYLSITFFGNFIKVFFDNQSTTIKKSLSDSLSQLITLFKTFSKLKNTFQTVYTKFLVLGNYYYKLISLIINLLPKVTNYKLVLFYTSRLNFLKKVEKQTIKLLPLIITIKLNEIIRLRQFYSTYIKNNYFLCINNTLLREYIKLVSLKLSSKPKQV